MLTIRPRRHSGITLVELLVVIAILVLLLALLIPAISRSRGTALTTQCQNNLRQLALGFRLYADAHNDRFPDGDGSPWFLQIAPFLEMQENVYWCPADPVSEDLGFNWRDDVAILPSAMLSRKKFSTIRNTELILLADRAMGWHSPDMINVAMVNGSVKMLSQEAYDENLLFDVSLGEISGR